jgi:FkbM family methyltransferase
MATRAWRLAMVSSAPWTVASIFILSRRTAFARQRPCPFRVGHLLLLARPVDWFAVEEVVVDGEYDFIEPLLADRDCPVVIDLGANVGAFAARLLSLRRDAEVHSVEASRDTAALLAVNRRRNEAANWHCYHYAVWAKSGEVEFSQGDVTTGRRIQEGGIRVPAITLTELLNRISEHRTIDLLKMDIEGAEGPVLVECRPALERVQHLIIELHPDLTDAGVCLDVLQRSFPTVWRIRHRASAKPLLLATRGWASQSDQTLERLLERVTCEF